jgi:hypothetical protein
MDLRTRLSIAGVLAALTAAIPSPLAAQSPHCPGYADSPLRQLVGTQGSDDLDGGRRAEVICGLGSGDQILGGGGNDILLGGGGPDIMFGDRGNDLVKGGRARDLLDGGDGSDRCIGGPGDDAIAPNCQGEAGPTSR